MGQELATANSTHVVLIIGLNAYHYWFGFDEGGVSDGRFYCEIWYLKYPPPTATYSGTFLYEEGWGSKAPARKIRKRGARASKPIRSAPRENSMRLKTEWPAPRKLRR
ncbi:MAG TPA: hypothetical protein PKK36_09525 [Kiritimatiellia bacterium]|nr:hypothetical protein [Kiritimatiellia bacterium]